MQERHTISTGLGMLLLLCLAIMDCSFGFSVTPVAVHDSVSQTSLHMGLFDGISKAFSNQAFKEQDSRVGASHILIKGEDIDQVLGTVKGLLGELQERQQTSDNSSTLPVIFAELARRDSQCPSAAQGGDLGVFGPGKMVPEFDQALFPEGHEPPVGSVVGPVVTEFGCHLILVTKRETNRDQVEEKLARND